MHVFRGRRLGALVSDSPRPEDAQPNPLPRGEGGTAFAASRTPGVYKSLRRRRAGVPVRVAGDVARLLGPAATLTPTLSLKGEGGRGGSVWVRWLRGRSLTSFLSPGRGTRAGLPVWVAGDVAGLLRPAATLTPTLSLKGEGGRGGSVWVRRLRGRPLTLALSRRRDLCLTGGGCPEDPHPNPLPRGEGGRADAASRMQRSLQGSLRRRRGGRSGAGC